VVQDAKSCYHTVGISFEGDENGFLDFLTLIIEGQCQEDLACSCLICILPVCLEAPYAFYMFLWLPIEKKFKAQSGVS